MISKTLLRRLSTAGAAVLLFGSAGCTLPPRTGAMTIPPVPVHQARVWFYRANEPISQQSDAVARIDGAAVGGAQNGSAFYRDVAPGRHVVSVDSDRDDGNQARIVDLAARQEVYADVAPFDNFVEGSSGGDMGGGGGYHRPTFYLWLRPADAARPVIAQSWFSGGPQTAAAALQ